MQWMRITVAVLTLAIGCSVVRAADVTAEADAIVDRYLEKIGLDELLVRRLSNRIAAMRPGEERADAVQVLAGAYARLLDDTENDEQRRRLEAAAADLIRNAPKEATTELRLSLARVTYRQLEETASQWMMAMADESDRQVTLRRLNELTGELDRLADRAQGEYQLYEQRETNERRPGMSRAWSERKAEAGRLRSMSHYLAGWSALHAADLEPLPERRIVRAKQSLAHLGWLLNARRGRAPELERLPEGTLVFEHVARAAVAAAAARAHAGDTVEAQAWFKTLDESSNVHSGAIAVLRQRRAIALAQVGRWEAVTGLVFSNDLEAAGESMDVADARLLAALAISSAADGPLAPRDERARNVVRDRALAALVAANELGHVLDLSRRFGLDQLGGDTFVAHQVRALRLYQQARDAHELRGEADAPTTDVSIAASYLMASAQFEAALNASDAAEYPDALGSAVMLLGLSRYYAGTAPSEGVALEADAGLLAAADAFERAARELRDPVRAAAALWMAIHTLQQVLEDNLSNDSSAIETRRDRLEVRFLATYPEHPQAAAITIRRSGTSTLSLEQRIEMLRKIDSASPMRASAERQATRLAYEAWREASTSSERDWMAARYLAMAEPLLADDRRSARDSEDAALRAVLRARRMAEVAMTMSAPDTARAQAALDVADALVAEGLSDSGIADELTYRRAQVAFADGDVERAQELVRALQSQDQRYAVAAQRLFFQHTRRVWLRIRSSDAAVPLVPLSDEQTTAARQLVDASVPFIQLLDQQSEDSASDAEALHICRELVGALCALQFGANDKSVAERAEAFNQRILDAQPRDGQALRRAAELHEAAGHLEQALEAWRMLLTGLPPGKAKWFEAKYRLVQLLAVHDPARARQVMNQHRVLHPTYGPAPWGERLRELDATLSQSLSEGGS